VHGLGEAQFFLFAHALSLGNILLRNEDGGKKTQNLEIKSASDFSN
jgi:hypothetical protein